LLYVLSARFGGAHANQDDRFVQRILVTAFSWIETAADPSKCGIRRTLWGVR
jgi:hypothetical protein